MNVSVYKDALQRKKSELTQAAGLRPLQHQMEHNNGRQGDMADQAAGNNEVHIQLRLKQTDAKILQAIDEALTRIGTVTVPAGSDVRAAVRERHGDDWLELVAIPGESIAWAIGEGVTP